MRSTALKTLSLLALAAPALTLAQSPSTLDKVKQAGTITLDRR